MHKKIIVRKAGHSKIMAIPAEMCQNLGIEMGTVLDVRQEDNKIIMVPIEVNK